MLMRFRMPSVWTTYCRSPLAGKSCACTVLIGDRLWVALAWELTYPSAVQDTFPTGSRCGISAGCIRLYGRISQRNLASVEESVDRLLCV
jgi:hypothetical protein